MSNLTQFLPNGQKFTPVQQGGGVGQLDNKLYVGWANDGKLHCQVDSTNFGATWPVNIGGNAATATSANSASSAGYATSAGTANSANTAGYASTAGSATNAINANFAISADSAANALTSFVSGTNGYAKIGGLIIQWGLVDCGATVYGSTSFPIGFPSAVLRLVVGASTTGYASQITAKDKTGFTWNRGGPLSSYMDYIAIGY